METNQNSWWKITRSNRACVTFEARTTEKTHSFGKTDQNGRIAKDVSMGGRNLYGPPNAGMPNALRG